MFFIKTHLIKLLSSLSSWINCVDFRIKLSFNLFLVCWCLFWTINVDHTVPLRVYFVSNIILIEQQ